MISIGGRLLLCAFLPAITGKYLAKLRIKYKQ